MSGSEVYERAKHVLDERARKSSGGRSATSQAPPINFGFVQMKELRTIAERDWQECWKALQAGCWKSVLVLSGGILETVLLDMLMARKKDALATSTGKKGDHDLTKWTLGKIVAVTEELGLLKPMIKMLPHPMKEYRNLAHPGDELREKLTFSEAEARAAFHTLESILGQLT